MLSSDILKNVFHLKNGKTTGSCFIIESGKKPYFITARHVIKDLKTNDKLDIFIDHRWRSFCLKTIFHHPTADVSAFRIEQNISLSGLGLQPSVRRIVQGQETYLLGFPDSLQHRKNRISSVIHPTPIVRKATLSCIIRDNTGHYLLLEGVNQPGFSGGPVVFLDQEDRTLKVAAVISGHKPSSQTNSPRGKLYPSSVIKDKTNIVVAYTVENVIDKTIYKT